MATLLSAIAKGAAYLYGGGGVEDDENEQKSNEANDTQNPYANENDNNNQSNNVIDSSQDGGLQYDPQNIVCSAKGELWRFHPKREEFKLLMREVEAMVIERDTNEFLSTFHIIDKKGKVLFAENINNNLQIQYNKDHHSMVFALYNAHKDRMDIMSFIFQNNKDEDNFKTSVAVKLYEFNRQESFQKMMKQKQINEEEKSWMTQSYEISAFNNDYQENEQDLQELQDDINAFDMNAMDIDIDTDDDDQDANDNDSNYDYQSPKRNKWQEAADQEYDNEEELFKYQSSEQEAINNNDSSPFKLKNENKSANNKAITGSNLFNRTYVVREMAKGKSALGYFKHNDENELEYQGKIMLNLKDSQQGFTPTKVMQHKSDRRMLLLSDKNPGIVNVLDLDRGEVIEEWETKQNDMGGLKDISHIKKHNQMQDCQLLYGMNNNSMFMIDERLPTASKCVNSKTIQYKSIHNLENIATSGNGFIATGSADGKIRLYNDVSKRAKTCLPGLGNNVNHIEITDDGLWILATCDDYIMVIPTQVPGTERTGFEGRGMGKLKPHPYVLRLKNSDIQKYKLRKVKFSPAHFDQGINIDEHWIISSTGPYIVKWNFAKLKKSGIVNSYSIRRAQSKVVHNEFRFNHDDDLLVTEANQVYAQHSSK